VFSNTLNAAEMKNYGGAASLTSSMLGEAAKYATYTAYNIADGGGWGSFAKAYDDMGGLTLNVANLGSIYDFAMSGMARMNGTGQLADSPDGIKFAEGLRSELGKRGVFEVNLGSGGVTARVGTGGIDLGGAVYDMAKRGIDNARIQRIQDAKTRETALINYAWGDWTAENTSMRITSGLDDLVFNNNLDGIGYTESNGQGGRTITIQDSGNANLNAVALQHESYRDGVVTADNRQETQMAALAHTQMAVRMLEGGQSIKYDEGLARDIYAYMTDGTVGFSSYVDKNYDSSADYFRIYKDKVGNITKVLDDGDILHATIVDADGSERTVALQGGSITAALAVIAANGMTKEQMNDLMVASGLWYEEGKAWYAKEDRGKYFQPGNWNNIGNGTFVAGIGDTLWGLQEATGRDWMTSDYKGDPLKPQIGQIVSFAAKNEANNYITVDSTDKASFRYLLGDGSPANIGPNTIAALLSHDTQLWKQNRITSGITPGPYEGDYGVDMTKTKDTFYIGKTTVLYSATYGSKFAVIDFTGFAEDGFWDIFASPDKTDGDREGPKYDIPGSKPYPFIPYRWTISVPNPRIK